MLPWPLLPRLPRLRVQVHGLHLGFVAEVAPRLPPRTGLRRVKVGRLGRRVGAVRRLCAATRHRARAPLDLHAWAALHHLPRTLSSPRMRTLLDSNSTLASHAWAAHGGSTRQHQAWAACSGGGGTRSTGRRRPRRRQRQRWHQDGMRRHIHRAATRGPPRCRGPPRGAHAAASRRCQPPLSTPRFPRAADGAALHPSLPLGRSLRRGWGLLDGHAGRPSPPRDGACSALPAARAHREAAGRWRTGRGPPAAARAARTAGRTRTWRGSRWRAARPGSRAR